VEILASHGDTQLGGDDFDQRLLDFVCDRFQTKHGIDLRQSVVGRSRMIGGRRRSQEAVVQPNPVVLIAEEFIAEKGGVPLNLHEEVTRNEYESLIEPLLAKTLKCLDDCARGREAPGPTDSQGGPLWVVHAHAPGFTDC